MGALAILTFWHDPADHRKDFRELRIATIRHFRAYLHDVSTYGSSSSFRQESR